MINAQKFAEKYLSGHVADLNTPAPWDMDPDYTVWAYEWGDELQHGLCMDTDGDYTVSVNYGEEVLSFGGLVEALQYVRKSFN